jgi:hypothetical protein
LPQDETRQGPHPALRATFSRKSVARAGEGFPVTSQHIDIIIFAEPDAPVFHPIASLTTILAKAEPLLYGGSFGFASAGPSDKIPGAPMDAVADAVLYFDDVVDCYGRNDGLLYCSFAVR